MWEWDKAQVPPMLYFWCKSKVFRIDNVVLGGGTEVKLDSDEGEPDKEPEALKHEPAPVEEVNLMDDSTPEADKEPEPVPITPISAEEERRPKLDVTQSTTTVSSKVSTRTSSKDDDKVR